MSDNIKERAFDRIWASREIALINAREQDPYWKIDPDRAFELSLSDSEDIDMWNYILTLIEKDRT